MKALVVIPARGGSKGLPRKNIKLLHGKPLIGYTIEAALEIFSKVDICISTDDVEIKQVSESFGIEVPFLRPDVLAQDTSGTHEVLLHALDFYRKKDKEYDVLVLLQPTSPFRNAKHIKACFDLYAPDLDMIVSVKKTNSNPYYSLFEENEEGFLVKSKTGNFSRRQDCPDVWEYNGAIYVINIKSLENGSISSFQKIKKFEMDEINSVDIDSKLDFIFAEFLVSQNNSLKST